MLATATRGPLSSYMSLLTASPSMPPSFASHDWGNSGRVSHGQESFPYRNGAFACPMRTGCGGFTPVQARETSLSIYRDCALAQLLALEDQVFADVSPLLYVDPVSEDKVDASMRDVSLTRLRSLHRAYYDLSPVVFCKAVCLVDTFITRVKVKPKYMMCVAAACYYIASKFETGKQTQLTVESLVCLTRCGGSSSDLVRMVDIILTKIGPSKVAAIGASAATALDFLSLFLNPDEEHSEYSSLPTFLVRQLEIALCSTSSALFRPSCLALALLALYTENAPLVCTEDSESPAFHSLQRITLNYLFTLANHYNVGWVDVDTCSRVLLDNGTLESYSVSPSKSPIMSSEVVWNLSRRTRLNLLGSTQPSLRTITEGVGEEDE
ncbi:unnamed protein product [Mesocestoides corti]|uniref:CYCLIN domain-containing protein n=2 Tax=Mesocestoides corti TaxID=53468 RepID=A0A0R3UMU1_MESCO|nr:unnamed protein product [Mesocestoides corti]